MTGLYGFQSSVSGMTGQSRAMEVISGNIANATTDGYKRASVDFRTLMSRTWSDPTGAPGDAGPLNTQSDIGGVGAMVRGHVSEAGQIQGTGEALDLAIAGRGLFVLGRDAAGVNGTVFSRAGHFTFAPRTPAGTAGHLIDGDGRFLMGWRIAADGTAAVDTPPVAMSIDYGGTTSAGQPTSQSKVALNLAANSTLGQTETFGLNVYDPTSQLAPLTLSLTKQAAGVWGANVAGGNGQTVTVTPEGAAPPAALNFDSRGQVMLPTTFNVQVSDAGGATWAFRLDLSTATQMGDVPGIFWTEQDGYPPGSLRAIEFDQGGRLIGRFDNGRSEALYQLALANFANPDGLAALAGTVYGDTTESGQAMVGVPGSDGLGLIEPESAELSTVDLAEEFSRMILTQNAYNSSATAFRTVDEMTEVVRDLKRA